MRLALSELGGRMAGIHMIEFPEIVRCVPGTHTVWDGIPDTIKVENILSYMVLFYVL